MEIQFAIVRSENREYLCYKAGEAYVDASNPMIAFAAGGKSSVRCPLKPSDSIPLCPNNPAH